MRIGLISDIHGNLVSLDAVLADIDRAGVDRIICLGDVASIGPQPCEVVARLRSLGCPCIMGNHDLEVINPDLVHEGESVSLWEIELINWCVAQLSETDINCIRSFKPWIEISLDAEASVLCFHGSPGSPFDGILATTPVEELDEMLGETEAKLMVGGHTHVQMLRQHRGTLILNPGSVGFPLEQMPFEGSPRYLPWAEYAVIGWTNGVLGVELKRVPIDLKRIKEAALSSGMPRAAAWLDLWRTP